MARQSDTRTLPLPLIPRQKGVADHVEARNLHRRGFRPPFLIDSWLVAVTVLLVGFGLIMIYSTTGVLTREKFSNPFYYVQRQTVAVVVGLVIMFLVSRIPIAQIKKYSVYGLPIALGLLALTHVPGIGDTAGGARRWVNLGIRFQPGEFTKLLYVIFLAGYFARHENTLAQLFDGIVKPMLLASLAGFLFLMQPDFGSTVVLIAVTLCMAASTGVRIRYLLIGAGFIALCLALLVVISPYRMGRVMSFLSPWQDASGKGYQLIQSLIAVGTGQITGVGLGDSQQKLFFLPAAHTDFIFAVIAEEFGFIGGLSVIACFLIFLWRGFKIAGRFAEDTFCYSLAVGLTMLVVVPALLNVGVVTGILPTKGMVLPLIGYGGSSVVVSLAGVGLLLALARTLQRQSL